MKTIIYIIMWLFLRKKKVKKSGRYPFKEPTTYREQLSFEEIIDGGFNV